MGLFLPTTSWKFFKDQISGAVRIEQKAELPFNLPYHDIVVWPALNWVYMLLAGVWAGVGVARQVWGCVVIWHHPLVPCHIPAHRLTSSRMVTEKSVKRKLSALIHHRFAKRRATDMRMRVTSHVIALVMRRGGAVVG